MWPSTVLERKLLGRSLNTKPCAPLLPTSLSLVVWETIESRTLSGEVPKGIVQMPLLGFGGSVMLFCEMTWELVGLAESLTDPSIMLLGSRCGREMGGRWEETAVLWGGLQTLTLVSSSEMPLLVRPLRTPMEPSYWKTKGTLKLQEWPVLEHWRKEKAKQSLSG